MSQLLMRRAHLRDLPLLDAQAWTLRVAEPSDAAALANVLQLAFPDASWAQEEVRARLLDAPDVVATYFMEEAGQVIATASARLLPELYPRSGYVHWVAAHPQHSGRRLGYHVSLAVLQCFLDIGCQDAVLETDSFRLAAIATYLKLGFRPEARGQDLELVWPDILRSLKTG